MEWNLPWDETTQHQVVKSDLANKRHQPSVLWGW
jgi:hypothetical protein